MGRNTSIPAIDRFFSYHPCIMTVLYIAQRHTVWFGIYRMIQWLRDRVGEIVGIAFCYPFGLARIISRGQGGLD